MEYYSAIKTNKQKQTYKLKTHMLSEKAKHKRQSNVWFYFYEILRKGSAL